VIQKKQGLPTKFLKSEKIYQRRVLTTTPREWSIPNITAKGPAAQVTFPVQGDISLPFTYFSF
jgi:hypothetical protein